MTFCLACSDSLGQDAEPAPHSAAPALSGALRVWRRPAPRREADISRLERDGMIGLEGAVLWRSRAAGRAGLCPFGAPARSLPLHLTDFGRSGCKSDSEEDRFPTRDSLHAIWSQHNCRGVFERGVRCSQNPRPQLIDEGPALRVADDE